MDFESCKILGLKNALKNKMLRKVYEEKFFLHIVKWKNPPKMIFNYTKKKFWNSKFEKFCT